MENAPSFHPRDVCVDAFGQILVADEGVIGAYALSKEEAIDPASNHWLLRPAKGTILLPSLSGGAHPASYAPSSVDHPTINRINRPMEILHTRDSQVPLKYVQIPHRRSCTLSTAVSFER